MSQVNNDTSLLELMVSDHARAPEDYRATARWAEYSERFLSFLREEGLNDFRRRRHEKGSPGAVLASFGALDLNPSSALATPENLFHAAASSFLGKGAKTIQELEASKIGNPEGFEIEGRFYTLSWLNYYCRYAYVSKFLPLDRQVIVEVGPGSGKQAEMLKKAHPGLTIILFDLPTQLYVCNQYLSKVFEGTDEVVGYRTGRTLEHFSQITPGKINILPHWKFPLVKDQPFDLLWNAASFQEMALETAKTYFALANKVKALYLMYNIKYRANVPPPGLRGIADPKMIPDFEETDRVSAKLALTPGTWLYFDSFWKKRSS